MRGGEVESEDGDAKKGVTEVEKEGNQFGQRRGEEEVDMVGLEVEVENNDGSEVEVENNVGSEVEKKGCEDEGAEVEMHGVRREEHRSRRAGTETLPPPPGKLYLVTFDGNIF